MELAFCLNFLDVSGEHHVNARLPQAHMIAARECFLSFRGKVALEPKARQSSDTRDTRDTTL